MPREPAPWTERTLELPGWEETAAPVTRALGPGAVVADRYELLGLLGAGGMGEVHRARDRRLDRVVALKVVGPRALDPRALARFEEEARVAARLEHPGVVPVHDLGELEDGRPFFTMKEVHGRTLEEVIAAARAQGGEPALRRVVDALRRACEAVAFAHAHGVVHRDLKPQNIMVGEFGEVLVLDWGLASLRGADEARAGAGTPAYMPPEAARGEAAALDARADVYALGATLIHVLTGAPPFAGLPPIHALAELTRGRTPTLPRDERIPDELAAIARAATHPDPAARPADAGALARALESWLDGAHRREQALARVVEADAQSAERERLLERARALREEAARHLGSLPPGATAEDRASAWILEDRAAELEQRAEDLDAAASLCLEDALQRCPDLPEAHDRVADRSRALHEAAEAAGDTLSARRHELRLRQHGATRHARYLAGEATLTLRTDPPGAELHLFRYEERLRRLHPEPLPSPGRAPLEEHPLKAGSYLIELRLPGRATVRYPVLLRRGEHWDGRPPGASAPSPVPLPPEGALRPGEIYVPPGPFWCGGELEALPHPLPWRRLWADGFVIERTLVTNRAWLAFLDALMDAGREEEALARAPRAPSTRPGEPGRPMLARGPDGRFQLGVDAEGHVWLPDAPVVHVSADDALSYARWRAARDGLPWRLPAELEWEKAARGVDGRIYPWGRAFDPDWAHSRESRRSREGPVTVGSYPLDQSPYGLLDLAGNVQSWCADPFPAGTAVRDGRVLPGEAGAGGDPRRVVRGGSFSHAAWFCRLDVRKFQLAHGVWGILGVRLARSVSDADWGQQAGSFDGSEPTP